ncbi:tetratricopeptide repeat protein [Candidatus Puniceispirillum sp.]|nr:tetratricopeptide repeat protein [Candidatus Puniceispirillum sp.]
MADIFDEINEDLKQDQLRKLWARYGKYVIILILLVVLSVGARQGYNIWHDKQTTTAAIAYHKAANADNSSEALTGLLGQLNAGYAMLARFDIAAAQAKDMEYTTAEASYLALSKDPDIKKLYRQAAVLLSVMNAPDSRDDNELVARLLGLESQAGPWQAMALEQAASLALRMGNRDLATRKYENLAGLSDIPAGIRQRARQMLQILEVR